MSARGAAASPVGGPMATPHAPHDARLLPPTWDAGAPSPGARRRAIAIALIGTLAVGAYLVWLARPSRVGNPALFGVLVVAELFNIVQALGFWWTCVFTPRRTATHASEPGELADVDVFIPTYDESIDVVEPTVAAAARLRGARVRVHLLDDGNRDAMAELARRYDIGYIRRAVHSGAKAGNINHALGITTAPFVAVLDCDHVPDPDLLVRSLPKFDGPPTREIDWRTGMEHRGVAFVQMPQYYANAGDNRIADAAWSQQSLFFGPIARGKDARETMFCCGTNVVFRRAALEEAGGFPEGSVTEDFELSIELNERGWSSAYVPTVLASGLGPEDFGAYVSQQHRWARGCVGALPRIVHANLPWRHRVQYLLSASYFLTGWTILVYLSMPVIRIFTGAQPIAGASADDFLVAFAPYFGLALAAVASVGGGNYRYSAYALAASTYWVHVHASCKALFRRPSRFVVTPKSTDSERQWRAAAPTLCTLAVLILAIAVGLARDRSAATLNNVAFAAMHTAVLCQGVATAILPSVARLAPLPLDDSERFEEEHAATAA